MPHVNQWSIHISANSKSTDTMELRPDQSLWAQHLSRALSFHHFCSGCFFRAQSTHVGKGEMFKMHGSVAVESVGLPPSFEREWYATNHPCHFQSNIMLASFLLHLRKATSRRLRDSCPQATIRNAILAMVKAQFDQFSLESQGLNASCEPMVNSHLCQFQIHRHHGVETRPKLMGSTFVESFEFPPFLLWMFFSCTKYTCWER